MKDKSIEEIERIASETALEGTRVWAFNELVRRLREVVPLFEDLMLRGEATGQGWAIRIGLKGLALVKDTAEAATGGDGTE